MKELDIFTDLSNAQLAYIRGEMTREDVEYVIDSSMAYIEKMPDGEKKDILFDKAILVEKSVK